MTDRPAGIAHAGLISAFRRRGDDNRTKSRNAVGRETSLAAVFADALLIGGVVDAIDLVVGDEALHLRPEVPQNSAGFLRNTLEFLGRQFAGIGDLTPDHVFWHPALLGRVLLTAQKILASATFLQNPASEESVS